MIFKKVKKITEIKNNAELLKPEKVYIPITSHQTPRANTLVEIGDQVKVGDKIAERIGLKLYPVFATVSGEVVGFENKVSSSGRVVDCIVIKNDFNNTFNENIEETNKELTRAEVLKRLKYNGIHNLGNQGIATYVKFDTVFEVEDIFINAVYENEPFITHDYEYLNNNIDEVVQGIKYLQTATKAKHLYLIVKEGMDVSRIEDKLEHNDIDLVTINVKKVSGWDYSIVEKITGKRLSRNTLEDKVLFSNLSTVKASYDAVKFNKPVTSKEVTVTGDFTNEATMFELVVGTPLTDVIKAMNGYKDQYDELEINVGGYLMGKTILSEDLVISDDISSINVHGIKHRPIKKITGADLAKEIFHLAKEEHDTRFEKHEEVCIRCGWCNDYCSVGILPQSIYVASTREDEYELNRLNVNQCIECGMCSFVCPSDIEVTEWVRRGKRRIM